MSGEISDSFQKIWRQFRVVVADLMRQYPFLFLLLVVALVIIFGLLCLNPNTTIILLATLVTIFAVLIFAQTDNFAETSLALMLGLFTVFSISWTPGKAVVFVFFLIVFFTLVFVVGAIKAAAKVEWILTEAAVHYAPQDHEKKTFEKLEAIAKESTPYGQIDLFQRAECVRHFAFRKIPLDAMAGLVALSERVTTVSGVTHTEAADFVDCLYHSFPNDERDVIQQKMIKFVNAVEQMPAQPSQFFAIYKDTRHYLLGGDVSHEEYLNQISDCLAKGKNLEKSVEALDQSWRV